MDLFSVRLKELREEAGYSSQQSFADAFGIAQSTVGNWEAGRRTPTQKMTVQLAKFFGVTVDYLCGNVNEPYFYLDNERILREINSWSDDENVKDDYFFFSNEALTLARDYDDLDNHGKKIVRLVANEEKTRIETERETATRKEQDQTDIETVIRYSVPGYTMPMSAGTGQPAGSGEPEDLELTKRPPRGTSFIAPVSGNSMEPTYHDGDKLFIHSCEQIEVGQVGVFLMDGQQWVKELGDGALISHNPKYAPIPMREDIKCQGLVLSVCDESYFE